MGTGARTALFSRKIKGGVYNIEDTGLTTGNRWFVDSSNGDSANGGTSPDNAMATIDQAINKATASEGDIIYVLPGHAETITAAGIDCDKIGLTIQGLGIGSNRPTITFSATTSDVDIDAAAITIKNLRFVSDVDSLEKFIDVNSAYFEMTDCEFVTSSGKEAVSFIDLATTVDNFIFRRCIFRQPTDPDGSDNAVNTGCFYIVDSENILVEDCEFYGEFESSIFNNRAAGTACKNFWIRRCFGEQALSTGDILTLVTGATGGMEYCSWNQPDNADVTTWGDFVTAGQGTFFGMHNVTFMNDNAGGELLAVPVAVATT